MPNALPPNACQRQSFAAMTKLLWFLVAGRHAATMTPCVFLYPSIEGRTFKIVHAWYQTTLLIRVAVVDCSLSHPNSRIPKLVIWKLINPSKGTSHLRRKCATEYLRGKDHGTPSWVWGSSYLKRADSYYALTHNFRIHFRWLQTQLYDPLDQGPYLPTIFAKMVMLGWQSNFQANFSPTCSSVARFTFFWAFLGIGNVKIAKTRIEVGPDWSLFSLFWIKFAVRKVDTRRIFFSRISFVVF